MNAIDLQIQSTVSDGTCSPGDIVALAKKNGVGVIALTDHNAVAGLPEAFMVGGECGVRVIPGIEVSAQANERGIHILGYGIRYSDEEFRAWLRENRAEKATPREAIERIHAAGGVAVWSHPAFGFLDQYEMLEDLLKEFVGWGLDGLEVLNPAHTEDDAEFLSGLVSQYKLLWTAGSDFHTPAPEGAAPRAGERGGGRTIGDYETYGFDTGEVVEKLDEAIGKRKLEA